MSGSSQNIETISTQFRILSTVKATMLSKFFICFLFGVNVLLWFTGYDSLPMD